MKVLVVLVIVSSIFLVPVISQTGYQYQVPETNYRVPTGIDGSLNNNNRQYYHVERHGSRPSVPSRTQQIPIHGFSSFRDSSTGPKQTISGISSINRVQGPSQTISRFGTDQSSQGVSSFSAGTTQIQKHFYFYGAPKEPEEVRTRVNIPVAPAKKNIKIILIKAPTYTAQAPLQIPVQPQNEEKTLVYVLVKKPEHAEINLPTPVKTKPSKPEVYFIKYKTEQEAKEAIANIQSGTDSTISVSAKSAKSDQDFINTIAQDQRIGHVGGSTGYISGTPYIKGAAVSTSSSSNALNVGGRVGTDSTAGIHRLYGSPN